MNRVARSILSAVSIATATLPTLGHAAEPQDLLQRMVTCQESWYEWKDNESRLDAFANTLDVDFQEGQRSGVLVPRRQAKLMGFDVVEVTPANVGIGMGFGVTVKGSLNDVRQKYEAALGRKLSSCEQIEGLSICTEPIAAQRNATLMMATQRPGVGTLVGCFYRSQR